MIIWPEARPETAQRHDAAIGSVLALLAAGLEGGAALLAAATAPNRALIADASGTLELIGKEVQVPLDLLRHEPVFLPAGGRVPLAWTMACGGRPSDFAAMPISGQELHLVVASRDQAIDPGLLAATATVIARLLAAGQRTRVQASAADRINSLLRYLPLPLLFVDSQGLELFFNDAARALLDIDPDEAQPSAVAAALARLMVSEGVDLPQAGLVADRKASLAFDIRRDDRIFKVESRWIDDGILSGRIWIFSDVTDTRNLLAQLATLAGEDALTGVLNRRSFENRFAAEIRQAERHGAPLSLLMLDLDHFKAINDNYGHPAGDTVLQDVSRISGALLRQSDILARVGGEEFAIVLPGLPSAAAIDVAERLCGAIRGATLVHEDLRLTVTCSIGVAVYEHRTDSAPSMIARADAALYAAKRQGRDRVVMSVAPA